MNAFTTQTEHLKERYDTDLWLGRVIWYSLTEDAAVPRDEFVSLAEELLADIDHTKLPSAPANFDVFKRACTNAQTKKVPMDDGRYVNYLVRSISSSGGNVWRNIVREVVDPEGHRLSYDEVVQLHFERATEQINVEVLNHYVWERDPGVEEVVERIKQYYDEEYNKITTYTIREFIRKNLEWKLKAIKVRPSGGIYFVHESAGEAADAFEALVTALPGTCVFHQLPLLDDVKQREMIREAFETESIEEVDTLIAEMRDIMKNDRKISSSTFADYHAKYSLLMEKIGDYSDLLDMALIKTSVRLEFMDDMLGDLLSQVR